MEKHEKQYLILRDFIKNQYGNMPSTWMAIWNDINGICRGEFYDDNALVNSIIVTNNEHGIIEILTEHDYLENLIDGVKNNTYDITDKYVEFFDDSRPAASYPSLNCKVDKALYLLKRMYDYDNEFMDDLFNIIVKHVNENSNN